MSDLKTFIFIGRSGCGKGTQAKMLMDTLAEDNRPIEYIEPGSKFREFITQGNYTSLLAKKIAEDGGLQPGFLTVHIWSHIFIEKLTGNEHIVMDGMPRRKIEAEVLLGALRFYSRPRVQVIYVNVSRGWAEERLLARGRADDARDDVSRRLDWFDQDVLPTLEYLKTQNDIELLDINGEQSIENVHAEIISKIF